MGHELGAAAKQNVIVNENETLIAGVIMSLYPELYLIIQSKAVTAHIHTAAVDGVPAATGVAADIGEIRRINITADCRSGEF